MRLLMILTLMFALPAGAEESSDTYNFVFKKEAKPGSVEPKGVVLPDKTEEFSKFEAHLGLVVMPASSGTGLSLGGQFNISRKFGLQVHLLSLQGEDDKNSSSSFSASGTEDKETKISSFGGSVAAVFTPVTLNENNLPIRLSLTGGLMLLSQTREEKVSTFSASGSNDVTSSSKSSKALPFVGVGATFQLAKQFGLVGYGKIASDSEYSQLGLSAAWLF